MDDWTILTLLTDIRSKMYNGESDTRQAIVDKLDELILKALNAIKTVEETTTDDEIPF